MCIILNNMIMVNLNQQNKRIQNLKNRLPFKVKNHQTNPIIHQDQINKSLINIKSLSTFIIPCHRINSTLKKTQQLRVKKTQIYSINNKILDFHHRDLWNKINLLLLFQIINFILPSNNIQEHHHKILINLLNNSLQDNNHKNL